MIPLRVITNLLILLYMKTTRNVAWGFLFALVLLFSCSENDLKISASDETVVENEATSDAYFEEVDDLSILAVASDDATSTGGKAGSAGRKININDKRFDCATVEIVVADDSTPEHPKGTITIDFGDGCQDKRGNVRTGKIIITYDGRRFFPGSKIVTTLEEYTINGIAIEGTRTVTNLSESLESNPKFNIVLVGGKVTWPDETFATRESDRTRECVRAANPINDEWHVDGTASGTNRNGVSYTMEIVETLIYKRECAIVNKVFIPVQGVKALTTENRQLTIDYGDGDCDRLVTITSDGETKDVEVRGDV